MGQTLLGSAVLGEPHGPMIVTVGTMGKVQMAGNQIVHVVAMRNSLMPARSVMTMVRVMALAAVGRCTADGVVWRHIEAMFIDVVAVQMVEMPVVQIVRVAVMKNGCMATPCPMLMAMLLVNRVLAHGWTPFVEGWLQVMMGV
ncbi:MAG: hypothetical protein NNA25_01375 [Nitrospira sp.]|nr:hypothetical protein [Nitrospira sp.]